MALTVAAVLLTLAVLGGGTLFALRLRGGNPPLPFAFVHGTFALAGFVTLLATVIATGRRDAPFLALFFFGASAPLGFWFLSLHLRGRLIPLAGVMLHGMVNLFGYTVLLTHFFA